MPRFILLDAITCLLLFEATVRLGITTCLATLLKFSYIEYIIYFL